MIAIIMIKDVSEGSNFYFITWLLREKGLKNQVIFFFCTLQK
jgi:hypothetical protein